ncbi:MAG: OmpW family outer membrane protein [Thermoanaerobaculia bacterium]
MTSRRFFTLLGFPAAAIVMLALVTSPVAGAENGWRLRVNGYWVDPDGRSTEVESDGVRILTDASSSFGFGVAAEYRFSRRLGTEFGLLGATAVDFEVRQQLPAGPVITFIDTTTFVPYFAGVNVHLTPGKKSDVYVGALLAYVTYTDLRITAPPGSVRVGLDSDIAPGVLLGLDVPVKDRGWFFNASIRYMVADFSTTLAGTRESVDFDPLIVGLGFGYRFKHH